MKNEEKWPAKFYYWVKSNILDGPDLPKDVFMFLLICLVGAGAFLLGRVMNMEESRKAELKIIQNGTVKAVDGIALPANENPVFSGLSSENISSENTMTGTSIHGMYVGSRNGTAYYLPWCGGVKLILEKNKVWFRSKEDAQAKGYKPAGNCKGI